MEGDPAGAAPHPRAVQAAPLWQLLQAVAGLVEGVWRGQSMSRLLEAVPPTLRPGAQALGFDVLRQLGTAQALRRQLAPRRPAPAVDALLCSALALLVPASGQAYPAFTLVDQAVEAAKRLVATRRQAPFLNACLRRFLRTPDAWLQAVAADPVARWNHPAWWIERLRRDHPQHWDRVLEADQSAAPLDLRVHRQRTSVAAYCARLEQAGIAHRPLGAMAVRLARPRPVRDIPGHAEGLVSVQSATAQRAAPLLLEGLASAAPRILDACAAPGGKTAHLLECRPQARVTALEVDAGRSQRIAENLARLGLQAEIRVADATQVEAWWDRQPFDAILLDAPCSASGIVRRHPDVRWLRRATDIAQLARQQDRLLAALWPTLAPGGRLLYCTCSVFRAEGEERIAAFLARNAQARKWPAPGHLLPGVAGPGSEVGDNPDRDQDGFFYALLEKRPP
ncbi:MAG TPA: 16S rRNA (cytosine(967)-C(5))-methyltransferase RsmB [Ottowia sp.]|uniref:16S rRNA (cytosine(967)-C(5))-methyltransferase RsmB n=1 Tax=Ottowia sp. TaxID=1898956 RepID=UPI002CCCCCAC|nr:16S rRNA (cytosine(967)-C(5))-methyltransferase RsmB [Ottowia sp.]HMN22635.1 16S rRNA (cytosine(967)-C(5))-methyltransferase RsmB [Ottowia sp.]